MTTPSRLEPVRSPQDEWALRFPLVSPVGDLLRGLYRARWFHTHSLPGSKRYPDTPAGVSEVLRRYNAVATDVLGEGTFCRCITSTFGLEPRDGWSVEWDRDDEQVVWAHFQTYDLTWRPGVCDALLCNVTDDATGPALIHAVGTQRVFAPYDGGADLFLDSIAERRAAVARFAEWVSPRTDGL